jgi:hypothetical protein
MPTFRVWDPTNGDRDDAREVGALDAGGAARRYAEDDGDGNADGVWLNGMGKSVLVEAEDGSTVRVLVRADVSITYHVCHVEEIHPCST